MICKLRIFQIALAAQYGQRVLGEREMDWRLRHTGAIHHLVDPQEVAGEQCLFERRRRYLVVLTHKHKQEVNEHQGIHYGVNPAHHRAHGRALHVFPPRPGHKLREIYVGEQNPCRQHPGVAEPYHPSHKNHRHYAEAHPARCLHARQPLLQRAVLHGVCIAVFSRLEIILLSCVVVHNLMRNISLQKYLK